MVPDNPSESTRRGRISPNNWGINVLGPFLRQQLLTPLLLKAAALPSTPKSSVRIILDLLKWAQSSVHARCSVNWDDLNLEKKLIQKGCRREVERYGQSKGVNVIQAYELACRYFYNEGLISFSLHPGALKTACRRMRWGGSM